MGLGQWLATMLKRVEYGLNVFYQQAPGDTGGGAPHRGPSVPGNVPTLTTVRRPP